MGNYIENTPERLKHVYELYLECAKKFQLFSNYLCDVSEDSSESKQMCKKIRRNTLFKISEEQLSLDAVLLNKTDLNVLKAVVDNLSQTGDSTGETMMKRFQLEQELCKMEQKILPIFNSANDSNQCDYRILHANGNVIITDPCYIVRNDCEHEDDWENCNFGQNMEALGIHAYLTRETMCGDWSCATINSDTGETIGYFGADAGMVSVFLLDEVLAYNPDFKYDENSWSATLVRDFHGTIEIRVVNERRNEEENITETYEQKCVQIVGTGNINFYTVQTGF